MVLEEREVRMDYAGIYTETKRMRRGWAKKNQFSYLAER